MIRVKNITAFEGKLNWEQAKGGSFSFFYLLFDLLPKKSGLKSLLERRKSGRFAARHECGAVRRMGWGGNLPISNRPREEKKSF